MKFEYYSEFFDGLLGKIKEEENKDQPIIETNFEVVESTLLTDQETCTGHECFYRRTGVRCIICKNR